MVKIISDGLLFNRALESVIGDLGHAQHERIPVTPIKKTQLKLKL